MPGFNEGLRLYLPKKFLEDNAPFKGTPVQALCSLFWEQLPWQKVGSVSCSFRSDQLAKAGGRVVEKQLLQMLLSLFVSVFNMGIVRNTWCSW